VGNDEECRTKVDVHTNDGNAPYEWGVVKYADVPLDDEFPPKQPGQKLNIAMSYIHGRTAPWPTPLPSRDERGE